MSHGHYPDLAYNINEFLLCARHYTKLFRSISIFKHHIYNIKVSTIINPHFMYEETEAWRGSVTCSVLSHS